MKKGDIKRVQILDAAEKLFYERGYDRTSVQDILTSLNMSKGGFYHYFDAKDSVLRAVYTDCGLESSGQGIAFSLPVDGVAGLKE